MHSLHSQEWGSTILLLSLHAPDLISLMSREIAQDLLGSLAAPRICLAQQLQEQAQLHGCGSALGQACCQYVRQAHSKNYFYWKRFASTKE